jgi:CxxC motif-containing protein (DUF1111 family)
MTKVLKLVALLFFVLALAIPMWMSTPVEGQGAVEAPTTDMDAKTDDLFNGFGNLGSPVDECVADAEPPQNGRGSGTFRENKFIFEERETVADGLGPTYNDVGCVECHQVTDTGGSSQSMEGRAGHLDFAGNFVDAPGGSLVHVRATDADITDRISSADPVRAFRVSLTTIGDGFIECIANGTLQNNVGAQPAGQQGTLINVPVTEANNNLRVGRFGWKAQHASLQSFAGDAYLNEMGITNPFDGGGGNSENPATTVNGVVNVTGPPFDPVPDPEDDGLDVIAFADFMAATRAPARGAITASVTRGDALFNSIGCAVCHTRTFTTAVAGTLINGGAFRVPTALGNKIIHPFSDFALHNVGTGDGIVQNGGQGTADQLRTPPLWGIRARNRLMHDGLTLTITEAINRHAGQATTARNNFNALGASSRADVVNFVLSL